MKKAWGIFALLSISTTIFLLIMIYKFAQAIETLS